MVIFGAGGDLTWRKLIPALFNLWIDEWIPEKFSILGVDLKQMEEEEFRDHLLDGVKKNSRREKFEADWWDDFSSQIHYLKADFMDSEAYVTIEEKIADLSEDWQVAVNCAFYQATPPSLVGGIVEQLGKSSIMENCQRSCIVLEKPFGRNLETAREMNEMLTNVFKERQIFRIDHYLGKETVQNILAFRFANALFEPLWDRRYIDHVQITVAEDIGVSHRGAYYDDAGALRDMVQNHLLQVLSLIAMEPPVSFEDEEIRNKKVDVLNAVRKISRDQVPNFAVRGQYGSGWIRGDKIQAYRDEPGVAEDSNTETFVALKLFVDNWRWQDVPFYLRTGKRLPAKVSEVCIQFKPVPHQSFPSSAIGDWQPNRLIVHIQPNEGILLRFQAKRPGPEVRLSPVDMRFTYKEAFQGEPPEAYETLLLDMMQGDRTLFMRADQVESAWKVVTPILDAWQAVGPEDFPNYSGGSRGPESAEVLIAQDGRSWIRPTVQEGD